MMPLSRFTVLDLTRVRSGPTCVRQLADWGANVIKVEATDAGSQRDFRAFASLAGHSLLREEVDGGVYRYWLRKA